MGPTRLALGKPVIAAIEGPAVAGGLVFWGNGYTASWATPGTTFYTFGLPKKH